MLSTIPVRPCWPRSPATHLNLPMIDSSTSLDPKRHSPSRVSRACPERTPATGGATCTLRRWPAVGEDPGIPGGIRIRGIQGTAYIIICLELFRTGFLSPQDTAKLLLQPLLKIVVAKHAACSLVLAELLELLFGHRTGQEPTPIARDLQQWRNLAPSNRPCPSGEPAHCSNDNRSARRPGRRVPD